MNNTKQAASAILWSAFIVIAVSLFASSRNPAHAATTKVAKGCPQHWQIDKDASEYADYKNKRLVEYQDMLCDRGIKDKVHLKLLAAQLLHENGSMTETRLGDNGCSFGLIQYNACAHGFPSAKALMKKHPEWTSYRYQLKWMADSVAWRINHYKGDIKKVVVSHNSPAAAQSGNVFHAGYYSRVLKQSYIFTL